MAQNKPNDIRLDKRKGQHILTNKHIISRQIKYADLRGTETVLEIGSGPGTLTFQLAESAKKVIAIEKDKRFISYLRDKIPNNVELIHADVMKIDLPEFDVVVANLPYQISSPITFKLLRSRFQKAILMYQKEFANRMVAEPATSSYSRLSVGIYYKSQCKILEYVPKSAFNPPPKVDGAIVELVPRLPPFKVEDETWFFEVVEALFSQKRKKIKNSISAFIGKKTKLDKSQIREFVQDLDKKDQRVETLTPEEIGALSDNVLKFSKNAPH
jgi:16S rRNA (adenine1518-N6/adenine1519-N6)-dimethyltransferase